MRKMKILFIALCVLLIGISGLLTVNIRSKEEPLSEERTYEPPSDNLYAGADLEDPNNNNDFLDMPIYYQCNYKDVACGKTNIATEGNLVTCLSMIYSYYNEPLPPDEFTVEYSSYINDLPTNKGSLIQEVANDCEVNMKELPYSFETMAGNVIKNNVVLLRIPNPSALSDTSTYIIIKGLNSDKNFIVRDPVKENIETESIYVINEKEPVYSPTLICEAVGEESQMYVFSRDEIYVPENEGMEVSENEEE